MMEEPIMKKLSFAVSNKLYANSLGFFILLMLSAAFISGCASTEQPPETPVPITEEELQERRERIRQYFEEKQSQRDIVATTVTESGQIIDWIYPESQTTDGVISQPPEEEAKFAQPDDSPQIDETTTENLAEDLPVQTELQNQRSAQGPEGTVPIVRFDVEAYLESVEVPPEDPEDVLTKMPPPDPASNDRYYVPWQRFGEFYGSAGRINIWDTAGPVNNETSIAQVAVIRGTPMQAIEAGKIELQSLNGNLQPHFFTYYRTNGSASGDWAGGYNTLVNGWIQYSPHVSPGMTIGAWTSQENGLQYSLDVEVRIHEGNWWVWAAGEWAGYYPQCRGGDAPPCDDGNLFSTNGLREIASRLDWYGEVYDSSAPAATSTDMGSGDFAEDWWEHAAYFRNVTFFWEPATYWWWDSGSISPTDPACYNVDGPYHNSDPAWRNWFFYGGPGNEAESCE